MDITSREWIAKAYNSWPKDDTTCQPGRLQHGWVEERFSDVSFRLCTKTCGECYAQDNYLEVSGPGPRRFKIKIDG